MSSETLFQPVIHTIGQYYHQRSLTPPDDVEWHQGASILETNNENLFFPILLPITFHFPYISILY